MMHVRTKWQPTEDGMVEVWFSVGPSLSRLRRVDRSIILHPSEWNAIDRLMSIGALLERPNFNYDEEPLLRPDEPDADSERGRRDTWRARHQLPEGPTRLRLLEKTS